MSDQHTPGPWSHDVEDARVEDSEGTTVCMIKEHGNINTVARCGETHSHADARLIAAAPDLLAACKSVLAGIDGIDFPYDLQAELAAAIAKAEGRQS